MSIAQRLADAGITLPEANVMRFVKTDKGEFLGREQTLQSMDADMP